MRILGSLAMLLLAAPLAAATPAPQAPTRATIIYQKSPGSEGGPAGGGGCDISRCPPICEYYYGPFAAMSMCYGKPKQCNHFDEASHLAYCTCEYGHDMPPKW